MTESSRLMKTPGLSTGLKFDVWLVDRFWNSFEEADPLCCSRRHRDWELTRPRERHCRPVRAPIPALAFPALAFPGTLRSPRRLSSFHLTGEGYETRHTLEHSVVVSNHLQAKEQ
jgi:hypothetical protein